MPRTSRNLQLIYANYRVIPLFLSISIAIDYTLTLYLAGSREAIPAIRIQPVAQICDGTQPRNHLSRVHNLLLLHISIHRVKTYQRRAGIQCWRCSYSTAEHNAPARWAIVGVQECMVFEYGAGALARFYRTCNCIFRLCNPSASIIYIHYNFYIYN